MFRDLLENVSRETSGERALETVGELSRHHRVQASPGYDAAAGWLAGRLESAGLEVEWERVPADGRTRRLGQIMPEGWECSQARALLHDDGRRELLCDSESEPLSLILRSAPASGRHPLVLVDPGDEPEHYGGIDVAGKVVLTSGDPHRVLELAVHERGAAGLLSFGRRLVPPARDAFDDPDALAYTSFWWHEEPRGWGFVVSPRVAARLRARLASGRRLELEVSIESRAFPTTLPLLSARLPGSSSAEALIVSHLCHPRPSANDNASGVAANLEAARALAALAREGRLGERSLGIRFLWVPELTGTYAWLAREGRSRSLVAALNLDMVGQDQEKCGSTLLLEHPPCFAASFGEELLLAIRAEAHARAVDPSNLAPAPRMRMAEAPYSGGSDHAPLVDPAQGVPCPMWIQWPDRFYHSSHDTPDKCDPASLELAARSAASYAGFLATAGARERTWLMGLVARGARRRLLAAIDEEDSTRAIERERLRGRTAIASLGRLGASAAAIEDAQRGFEDFARREAGRPATAEPALGASRVPSRALPVPLPFPRRHWPGWGALAREEKERWRRAEREVTDAATLGELAWFACDGRRTLAEIAHLVWLESGRSCPSYVDSHFERLARLGLCAWSEEDAWNPSEPRSAGR